MSKTKAPKTVIASFVFVDRLEQPIAGLSIKLLSRNLEQIASTDEKGHAFTFDNAIRDEEISIFIKKKSGIFELRGKVKPKHDVNAYTIKSPELHIEALTRLTPREEVEEDLPIPVLKNGETMTMARLLGEFAPYILAPVKTTEVGKTVKFTNSKTSTKPPISSAQTSPSSADSVQYKVIKTDKPKTTTLSLLGTTLNQPSTSVSEETYSTMAKELECEPEALKAVASVESGDGGFLANGLPKILFERHKFYAFTKPDNKSTGKDKKERQSPTTPHPFTKYPDICHPKPGAYGSLDSQYSRLIKAAKLDKDAAIKACSWGAFQVLAEYYELCGYNSAEELANDCMKSAEAHIKLFFSFLRMPEKRKAIEALQKKDWAQFATYYNGANWRTQNPLYAEKMENSYEENKK